MTAGTLPSREGVGSTPLLRMFGSAGENQLLQPRTPFPYFD